MTEPQPITQFPSLLPIPQRLEGERVVVRGYRDEDALALLEAINESRESLAPWMPWVHAVKALDDRVDYVRKMQARFLAPTGDYGYGIFDRASGRYLGGTGLHRINWEIPCMEIGYWLRISAHGHGYVTEATRLLTTAAFATLGAARVEIRCDATNEKSANVPRRLGFIEEARLRCERRNAHGELSDTLIFALTWNVWRAQLR